MSVHDFWHEDMDLITAYEKAYINHLYQSAYVNGAYIEQAVSVAYNNFWSKGKKYVYAKEVQMRDMIDELTKKQYERYAQYKFERNRLMSQKYQMANNSWI